MVPVAPAMSVKCAPLSVLTCHCTVPVAVTEKVAVPPAQTVLGKGLLTVASGLTVKVAGEDVTEEGPQVEEVPVTTTV